MKRNLQKHVTAYKIAALSKVKTSFQAAKETLLALNPNFFESFSFLPAILNKDFSVIPGYIFFKKEKETLMA